MAFHVLAPSNTRCPCETHGDRLIQSRRDAICCFEEGLSLWMNYLNNPAFVLTRNWEDLNFNMLEAAEHNPDFRLLSGCTPAGRAAPSTAGGDEPCLCLAASRGCSAGCRALLSSGCGHRAAANLPPRADRPFPRANLSPAPATHSNLLSLFQAPNIWEATRGKTRPSQQFCAL